MAAQRTTVVPTGNRDPDVALHETTTPPPASNAVGSEKSTMEPTVGEPVILTVGGHVISGTTLSRTFTARIQLDEAPAILETEQPM